MVDRNTPSFEYTCGTSVNVLQQYVTEWWIGRVNKVRSTILAGACAQPVEKNYCRMPTKYRTRLGAKQLLQN